MKNVIDGLIEEYKDDGDRGKLINNSIILKFIEQIQANTFKYGEVLCIPTTYDKKKVTFPNVRAEIKTTYLAIKDNNKIYFFSVSNENSLIIDRVPYATYFLEKKIIEFRYDDGTMNIVFKNKLDSLGIVSSGIIINNIYNVIKNFVESKLEMYKKTNEYKHLVDKEWKECLFEILKDKSNLNDAFQPLTECTDYESFLTEKKEYCDNEVLNIVLKNMWNTLKNDKNYLVQYIEDKDTLISKIKDSINKDWYKTISSVKNTRGVYLYYKYIMENCKNELRHYDQIRLYKTTLSKISREIKGAIDDKKSFSVIKENSEVKVSSNIFITSNDCKNIYNLRSDIPYIYLEYSSLFRIYDIINEIPFSLKYRNKIFYQFSKERMAELKKQFAPIAECLIE